LSEQQPPPLPGWLGSAVQVTTQVGIPTVFAMVLLWYVLFKFEGSMDKITARLESNAQSVQEFTKVQTLQLGELQRQTKALEDIARQRHVQPQAFTLDYKGEE
jgi:hypothetical protein